MRRKESPGRTNREAAFGMALKYGQEEQEINSKSLGP
jgi:hypothetical protein